MTKDIVIRQEKEIKIEFRNTNLSAHTKSRYKNIVKEYYQFLLDNDLGEGINSVKEWLNTKRNPATYNLTLQAIKDFLIKRYENEPVDRKIELMEMLSSIKRKKAIKAKTELDYLTKDQIEVLTKVLTESIALIVWSLFWTGCRVSELINIKIKDCTVEDVISIRVIGKGSKERAVYLPVELYNDIRNSFKGKEYLFETKGGNKYKRTYITHELRRQSLNKMNMRVFAHILRHSKAMYLKDERKLSPDQISKSLGHSSILTTLTYYFHGIPSAQEQGIL